MKGGPVMKMLSSKKLAETTTKLRELKGLTKEELGKLTGINRIMIGRIERGDFTPSIVQFEALAKVLSFDLTDMFIEKEKNKPFIYETYSSPLCSSIIGCLFGPAGTIARIESEQRYLISFERAGYPHRPGHVATRYNRTYLHGFVAKHRCQYHPPHRRRQFYHYIG